MTIVMLKDALGSDNSDDGIKMPVMVYKTGQKYKINDPDLIAGFLSLGVAEKVQPIKLATQKKKKRKTKKKIRKSVENKALKRASENKVR